MPRRPVLLLLVAIVALTGAGSPASAHQRATLTIESPAEGSTVGAGRVEVVITASGGALAAVDFAVHLDDQPVDVTGDLGSGSVFTAHSLRAGAREQLSVPVADSGEHELRLVYAADADDPRPDVVRRFTADDSIGSVSVSGGGVSIAWPVVLAAAALIGAAVVVRRRRLRAT